MDTDGTAPSARRRRGPKSDAEGGTTPGGGGRHQAPRSGESQAPERGSPAEPGPVAVPVARAGELAPLGLSREGLNLPEATLASLDLQRGAIGRLDAQEVTVSQGAIGAARAETIRVELGAVGAAMANEAHVSQAGIGTLVAGRARLEQAAVRTLIARDVIVERPSLVGFLVARRVSGDVRVLFDWRGAVAFGVIVGLIARLGRGRR